MSQWARNNPELAEQGVDQYDALTDLTDRDEPAELPEFGPTIDTYEGSRRAIQDRIEREYDRYGPSPEERFNQGRGYYE